MDLEKSMVCLRTKSRVLSGLLLASLAAIILMLLFIFTVSFGAAHSLTLKDPWSKWGGISPDPVVLQSRHLGGVPGYQIIENVWVNNGSIYLFAPDRYELPSKSRTVSGDTGWEVFTHPSKEMMEFARGARVLEGTTLFVNDGAKSDEWHYLSSYYHMIGEVFLGSIAAIASIPYKSSILTETTRSGVKVPSIPDRMVIPWEAATDWRDEEGLGELVLKGIFGENLLEPMHWKELSADGGRNHGWVFLQRAVIIDRWASHRHNALSDSLNKMAATVLSLPRPPFFFIPSRISLLSHLHIPIPPTRPGPVKIWNKVPKIVYVDRQGTNRRMTEDSHAGVAVVLGELEASGIAIVEHKKMERLDRAQQIEAVSTADILIGVHGEMLTHQLWMPDGGVVIELFPSGSYLPEHQIVADALHHEYVPVWHDVALSREEWESLPRQHGHHALYDGTEVTVDKVYFRLLLEEIISRMTEPSIH
nr:hypothetical protein L204_06220 [Cryptococcus depauperatus CBS 7855]